MTSQAPSAAEYVLKAKVDNVKNLSQLLKCIHFKDNATCFASSSGLKVVVEDAKCTQAAAFVGTDIFQEYELKENIIGFRLDLSILLECLTIFDTGSGANSTTHTTLNMYYAGYGSPLRLLLLEDDFVTDCSIQTMEASDIVYFNITPEETVNKIIVDGPAFKELVNDLDPSSEYVEFLMSPDPPHFRMTTLSNLGKCHFSIPKEAEIVEEFSSKASAATRYKYSQVKPALKPIQAATKVSLQTDEIGLLCFQFMIKTESRQYCYIEYFCTPILPDDSD